MPLIKLSTEDNEKPKWDSLPKGTLVIWETFLCIKLPKGIYTEDENLIYAIDLASGDYISSKIILRDFTLVPDGTSYTLTQDINQKF